MEEVAAEVAAVWSIMTQLVGGIWYIPAIIVALSLVVALVNAVKRGTGV